MHLPRILHFSQVLKETERLFLRVESIFPGFSLSSDAQAEQSGCRHLQGDAPQMPSRLSTQMAESLLVQRPRTVSYSLSKADLIWPWLALQKVHSKVKHFSSDSALCINSQPKLI